jgi:hypothetical protein
MISSFEFRASNLPFYPLCFLRSLRLNFFFGCGPAALGFGPYSFPMPFTGTLACFIFSPVS